MKENKGIRVHLMGMGGIGMSALAQVLSSLGARVSGCDLQRSSITKKLQDLGIRFLQGHDPSHLEEVDILVCSSAITISNEVNDAKALGIPIYSRGQLLAQLVNQKRSIAVCGAHGKTTTTALISTVLKENNLNPTFLIGGEADNLGGNAQMSTGDIWVTEADESDGSFLELRPKIGVVTNIDREHLDFYKSDEQIEQAYLKFMEYTLMGGVLVVCKDDPWIGKLLKKINGKIITYGTNSDAMIGARNIRFFPFSSEFDLEKEGQCLIHVKTHLPGQHNVLNTLAAFAVGMEVGLLTKQIVDAVEVFRGVRRRFQVKNQDGDVWVIDDYAHHPTEIAATLQSVKGLGRKRTIGIFQPHRYTRTQALLTELGQVLQKVDYLILTEIYSASEPPIDGISGRQLYEKVVEYGHRCCEFIEEKNEMVDHLLNMTQAGDTLLFLGAGDITKIADEVARKLKERTHELTH